MLLADIYKDSRFVKALQDALARGVDRIHLNGMTGSIPAAVCAALSTAQQDRSHLLIAANKEEAYYLLNDLESLLDETDTEIDNKRVLLFPASYRKQHTQDSSPDLFETDNANVMQRSEVVKQLGAGRRMMVVTYPEAIFEKVMSKRTLTRNTLRIAKGTQVDMDFIVETLQEYDFSRVDFVVEPGQYAVRGGIIDVYSYANEYPFRIEFFGDDIDSLRTFDPGSQLSVKQLDQISILPNLERRAKDTVTIEERVPLLSYFGSNDCVWLQGLMFLCETVESLYAKAQKDDQYYLSGNGFLHDLLRCRVVEYGNSTYFSSCETLAMTSEPQPAFNKQFELLLTTLGQYTEQGYRILITITNENQQRRLEKIFAERETLHPDATPPLVEFVDATVNRGFIDHDEHLVCFTDHEIFERYHKYTVRDMRDAHQAMTIKELFELKPGDYVTHIDYGVGRFSGLEKITTNGHTQEVIRLVYKNNDTLYISIHGLHKISRYVGKDGTEPPLNRLGSNTWQVLKQKTKKQVKDIAKDLIALYAKRKASRGFAFSADNYMQEQLEASFFYEDTPDQLKATQEVKRDMESQVPMDRLVCGDVGFGKTEVAIRAAFKACCDSKQVAVLVPNTILAFQHFNTFTERLKGMPVRIDYLNRFRSTKDKNRIYKEVEEGKIDILIGTHAITNKSLKFKDLGLLIIDEEQKFGVSVKEKLREMKVNVDCLTLTATPIPRTLQFSLMGARDLSVIQTPPPNRQPIQTELCSFDETVIRDAIRFEMSRGGQTFFISNRVENLPEMAGLVSRLAPDARVGIAHGQMDGKKVEETMMLFLSGEIDVLVATAIIENGLDIPNANTMIVNNAQQFGLSDLHQIRGRVGRSNKKAFCYLLIPSYSVLTDEAQKRLRAIEEFSTIGSGLNIAMRDLDIRGAGNILGAEQSGFISDIGFDMYHKILNEAIEELYDELGMRNEKLGIEDGNHNSSSLIPNSSFVKECIIETDLEVLLPDDYVSSVSERLLLYRELNDLRTEQELDSYRERLIDRFGPIPVPTQELINTITLRQMAKDFGIEKLVLKQGKMVFHFVANQNNPFYQSDNFNRMIDYVTTHPRRLHLKETPDRLSLVCDDITSIQSAIALLQRMTEASTMQTL